MAIPFAPHISIIIITSSHHRIITLKLPHSGEAGKCRLFLAK
jgi:hypothetical protein